MISFYPGPSRVHNEIPRYVTDAFTQGIMSINHRSETFVKMSERTITLLKEKLSIPRNYTVFYTTSATECWEIISQSLVNGKSYHLYNGAFGQKWYDYTQRLHPEAEPFAFDREQQLDARKLNLSTEPGVICITQNETSNGTQVSNRAIRAIRKAYPEHIIAVDATSSMAGVVLDFKAADVWFASVQKCFGLPAGLGLMICSPQALQQAAALGENKHYNSLNVMAEMMAKWQTSCTPNVLGIYLLMRVLEKMPPIAEVHAELEQRYTDWVSFLQKRNVMRHLVDNAAVHSHTVIPVTAEPDMLTAIKKKALKQGLLLGEGYGNWKTTTFRIANFPALKAAEIRTLKNLLKTFD